MGSEKIQWHPVFAAAIKLELKEYYPEILEIEEEHQLSSKPLAVDILVIKKRKDVKILRNIAQIFVGHNIIEYKSPDDYISIDDYYKVKAYAYLYKTLVEKVDSIKLQDISITLVSNNYPKAMTAHIKKELNKNIVNHSEGIYYIEGEDIATQIIVIDQLPRKVNRYIRLLTKRANIKAEMLEVIDESIKEPKNNLYESLMNIIATIHVSKIMEVYEMTYKLTDKDMERLERIMEKFNLKNKYLDEGMEKGMEKEKIESILELLEEISDVPQELEKTIRKQKDMEKLRGWLKLAAKVSSIDEFISKINDEQ